MNLLEIWLLAISLAMDCLAVSIASGIIFKKIQFRPMLTMAFFFGLFQAAMPLIGWLGASTFSRYIESFDHWLAFIILCFLGFRMIRESYTSNNDKPTFNPANFKVVISLAIATSIDALAVGFSFAFLGINQFSEIISPVSIIGIVSFIFSIGGLIFGSCCGLGRKIRVELWGGIILIIIGIKILIEHQFFQ